MDQEEKKMKPIWYFVGLMLSAMGTVVFITGLVNYSREAAIKTVLSETHPELWWGAITIVAGLLFLWTNRKATGR
jgi:hypothetical protein